jgi:hypothetical protein
MTKNPSQKLKESDFPYLMKEPWVDAFSMHNLFSGFEVTGLFPINAKKIIEKCVDYNGDVNQHPKNDVNMEECELLLSFSQCRG